MWAGSARIVVVSLCAATAGGCAEMRWVHPTADEAQTAADLQACDRAAYVQAQQQVTFEALGRPPVIRGGVIGYPVRRDSLWEHNSELYWEQYFRESCMRAKGYQLVQEN